MQPTNDDFNNDSVYTGFGIPRAGDFFLPPEEGTSAETDPELSEEDHVPNKEETSIDSYDTASDFSGEEPGETVLAAGYQPAEEEPGETVLGKSGRWEEEDPGETRLPEDDEVGLTRLPGGITTAGVFPSSAARSKEDEWNPGDTIAASYIVDKEAGKRGNESVVYIARKEGTDYAVKVYHRGRQPSPAFTALLKDCTSPYVARPLESGMTRDLYYEVYDYYRNGTLADQGKCTMTFIRSVVIPSVNEGLHALHTLGETGIVHGDIKPDNLFISNDEKSVIIGDFGISSQLDENGKLIDVERGTPEYAPPTRGMFGRTTKTPAYDYASFGLVLIRLATGHSLFEGLDITGINRAWEEGIEVPSGIESRLRRLIEGLLDKDEDRRFGYEEVKRWINGEFIQKKDNSIYTPEDFVDQKTIQPMIFGFFDGKVMMVGSRRELAGAMAQHWEHAKKVLNRPALYDFLSQLDAAENQQGTTNLKLSETVKKISQLHHKDEAVFRAIYQIYPLPHLFYREKDYGSLQQFIETLASNPTPDQEDILKRGLLEFYLSCLGVDQEVVQQVHEIIHKGAEEHIQEISNILYFSLGSSKEIDVHGKKAANVSEFTDEITHMDIDQIEQAAMDPKVIGWLYSQGFREEALALSDI